MTDDDPAMAMFRKAVRLIARQAASDVSNCQGTYLGTNTAEPYGVTPISVATGTGTST